MLGFIKSVPVLREDLLCYIYNINAKNKFGVLCIMMCVLGG